MLTRFSSRPVRLARRSRARRRRSRARAARPDRPGAAAGLARRSGHRPPVCSSARRTVTRATPNCRHQCQFARHAVGEAPFLPTARAAPGRSGGTWAGARRTPCGHRRVLQNVLSMGHLRAGRGGSSLGCHTHGCSCPKADVKCHRWQDAQADGFRVEAQAPLRDFCATLPWCATQIYCATLMGGRPKALPLRAARRNHSPWTVSSTLADARPLVFEFVGRRYLPFTFPVADQDTQRLVLAQPVGTDRHQPPASLKHAAGMQDASDSKRPRGADSSARHRTTRPAAPPCIGESPRTRPGRRGRTHSDVAGAGLVAPAHLLTRASRSRRLQPPRSLRYRVVKQFRIAGIVPALPQDLFRHKPQEDAARHSRVQPPLRVALRDRRRRSDALLKRHHQPASLAHLAFR